MNQKTESSQDIDVGSIQSIDTAREKNAPLRPCPMGSIPSMEVCQAFFPEIDLKITKSCLKSFAKWQNLRLKLGSNPF